MTDRPPARSPHQVGWIWVVYAVLFGASVPWYVPDGPLRLWFGVPHWVVISLGAIAGVACFTVFVVRRYWTGDEADAP